MMTSFPSSVALASFWWSRDGVFRRASLSLTIFRVLYLKKFVCLECVVNLISQKLCNDMARYAIVADAANVELAYGDQDFSLFKGDRLTTTTIVAPTFKPALSPQVHLSLTVAYFVLYGFLFLFVYAQLWMILYYKHKRLSYQTVFLFLCLIWSGLRITLFSFYFNDCIAANQLSLAPEWILYCFPVCLQFTTICLLVLYFAQVVYKAKVKYEPNRYKLWLRVAVVSSIILFVLVNILCEVVSFRNRTSYSLITLTVIQVRVAVNDTLFLIYGVFLAVCIYKVARLSSANLVLEAKGTTRCQALTVGIVTVLLFTSRAAYNMLAISLPSMPGFGFDWINVSDQADLTDLDRGYTFLSFGIVLFIWEFLPTFILVIFFRVQRPVSESAAKDQSENSQSSRAYFFDNPRRYDSDEDLSRSHINGSPRGSMNDISSSPYAITNSLATRYGTQRIATPKYSGSRGSRGSRAVSGSSFSGYFGATSEESPSSMSYQHQRVAALSADTTPQTHKDYSGI